MKSAAILTAVTGDKYKWQWGVTNPLKEAYCKKWGYDYIFIEYGKSPTGRHPYWDMIWYLKKYLKEYNYVMWLDADAAPVNFEYSIEGKAEGKYDAWIGIETTRGREYCNTGSMIVKNTEWSFKMLEYWGSEKVYNRFRGHGNPEQDALNELWHANEEGFKDHIKYEPLRYMNTVGVGCGRCWKPGDWIKHICRSYKDERFRKLFLEGVDKKLVKEVFKD